MTYEQLKTVNQAISLTDIKGKQYAPVSERIKAFRMLYPDGYITTQMLSNADGICIFRAECGYYDDGYPRILGTGTSYEVEGSSYINKTSYIENCETSAVGRALGMAGIGDTSVASAEEVAEAQRRQEEPAGPATAEQIAFLTAAYKDSPEKLEKLLKRFKIRDLSELPTDKATTLIMRINAAKLREATSLIREE